MLSKSKLGVYCSLNVVSLFLSTVTLLFVFAGLLRIELKMNHQEAKLAALSQQCTERTKDGSSQLKGKKVKLLLFLLIYS